MTTTSIFLGKTILNDQTAKVAGEFVKINNQDFYKINNYDQMRPFFIGVVSDSDHWLYTSSKGGLSAGRKNPGNALFPYYTDDKIHDSEEQIGSKTIVLVEKEEKTFLWTPFSDQYNGVYQIERNLYKSTTGNKLIFEEINKDLSIGFTYTWAFSQQYGFIKKSRLSNLGTTTLKIRLLDGFQNLLPYGVDLKMQTERSTLLDAYKKNELLAASGLGLFLLSSVPVDKAEPSEALKATTVWQTGLEVKTHLLCSLQLANFQKGIAIENEVDVRAERGAYLVESHFDLKEGEERTWYFAAELNQGPTDVVALDQWIQKNNGLVEAIENDIALGTKELIKIVAAADGLQKSKDKMLNARHFANVMFNVMRGGIFDHNYRVEKQNLLEVINTFNKRVVERNADFLAGLPDQMTYPELMSSVHAIDDSQLQRLCLEYLPLTFSRRHGDPSRPWNKFSIEVRDDAGKKKLNYQGNWRDIFQNWEVLGVSYPLFIESMISKFVSASTPDGYNPYRVTSEGIDWEVIEEDDPWSYIGYWGDHQIIYLQKLLELSQQHHPGELERMLSQPLFAYANVPYRIRDYKDILANPHDTIDFDHALENEVNDRVAQMGSDGKLLLNKKEEVYLVNLTEKLLVSLLAKLSNFIPEGGIWLNTQRPEWNDANNALVGNGVSMVTLYYIRRFVRFCQQLFAKLDADQLEVSEEVVELFEAIAQTFERHQSQLEGTIDNTLRRQIMDELGQAGEVYRNKIYQGFSEKTATVNIQKLDIFFSHVLAFTDHSIRHNQRADKLFHSYNLMQVEKDGGVAVEYLYEMLEGQVAVLSSGLLKPEESLEVIKALRTSALYREDQHSYILYPDRQLPRFEVKNNIPAEAIRQSTLLSEMINNHDHRVVVKDAIGQYHFNSDFHNGKDLEAMLDSISDSAYGSLIAKEKEQILEVFESVFDHRSFTGRSGTFFGYEGLGCIYWHMVSKLILAAQESCLQAIKRETDSNVRNQLTEHYYDLRSGLGTYKTPDNYGAFPFDPYSHTPGNAGAQQPGMTGQVKEDILSRFGELGVFVENGQIIFRPDILEKDEFLEDATTFNYYNIDGVAKQLDLAMGSLVFTYCQVPVVYSQQGKPGIILHLSDGKTVVFDDLQINQEWSASVMARDGQVNRIDVSLYF